jgi:FkbM family methyltransferase
MTLFRKIKSLIDNPVRLPAYAEWVTAKVLHRRPPLRRLPGGAQIGHWLSFSEYWSFHDLVPENERLFVERCLSANAGTEMVAIDIGANVGLFTCLMAGSGRHVHAFEPIPETFCRLKKNVQFNDLLNRVHLNCLAVGKEQGLVSFQIDETDAATNRWTGSGELVQSTQVTTQLVATTSLDDYCRRQKIGMVDLVKLDVEGMEPYVLQGAQSLLAERRVKAFLIEICPVNLRSVGLSPADLYCEFQAAAYSPFVLNEDGSPGAKLSLGDIEALSLANVALLPDA